MLSTNVRLRRLARAGLLTRRAIPPRRHKRRRHIAAVDIAAVIDDALVSRVAWAAVEALDARLRGGEVTIAVGEVVETALGSLVDAADRDAVAARVAEFVVRPR